MAVNKNLVRQLNEQHVLTQVFNHGPLSRSQIAKNLKLNKVTVSDIVAELEEKQKILKLGQGDSTKNGGRKPTLLEFNADQGCVIVYDLGADFLDRMVTKLDGSILAVTRTLTGQIPIKQRLDLLVKLTSTANLAASLPLLGVAVGIHGIVSENQVLYSPYIDLQQIDIAQYLTEQLHLPVLLENEANLAAMYERDFDSKESVADLVCISIHKGIGAGIILNNQLYTGRHGEAGEIGHTVLYNDRLGQRQQLRTVESLCSEDALIKQAKRATEDESLTRQMLVAQYRQQSPAIIKVVDNFCYDIASVIYNTGVTFAPQQIALNSPLVAALPELMPKIKAQLPHLTNNDAPLVLVKDVRNAILLGGASNIIHALLQVAPGTLTFR